MFLKTYIHKQFSVFLGFSSHKISSSSFWHFLTNILVEFFSLQICWFFLHTFQIILSFVGRKIKEKWNCYCTFNIAQLLGQHIFRPFLEGERVWKTLSRTWPTHILNIYIYLDIYIDIYIYLYIYIYIYLYI